MMAKLAVTLTSAVTFVSVRGLTVERVQVPGGRSSLVVLVRRPDGEPAVLKLAPPRARPESERAALAHWDGLGAVQVLEPFVTEGVLLLPASTFGFGGDAPKGEGP